MPTFMTRVSYTADSWRAQIDNPQNREQRLRAIAEENGTTVLGFYYTFSEYDVVVILSAPDEVTAASILIAAAGSGSIAKSETNLLLTAEEGLAAIRRASNTGYSPPGMSS